MLPKDGDLDGIHAEAVVPETVKDDLPSKGIPYYAEVKRLIADNWVASAHSIVVRDDGREPFLSTSNLFRSDAVTQQIWSFWGSTPRGVTVRDYPAPGAPAGAKLQWGTSDQHARFELSRRQGGVISAVVLFGHPHERFTRLQLHRITIFLVHAANVQGRKVANVSPLL